MEYLRGLRRLREDPDWLRKVGIGSLLLLSSLILPIVGQVIVFGWGALIVRRAVAGQQTPLPRLELEFDSLGRLFGTGLKVFLAFLIWGLPVGLVVGAGAICLQMSIVFGSMVEPAGAPAWTGVVAVGAALVGLPVLAIVGLLLSLPAQMSMLRAELSDDLNRAMQFREVLDMTKKVLRELIVGSIILAVVQMVMVFASVLLCWLPLLPCLVAMTVARAHFASQLYELYLARGGSPLPMGPLDLDAGPAATSSA